MSMRTQPLSAVCIERLNALQPKQSCWSEGYLKPKLGTYCHLPEGLFLMYVVCGSFSHSLFHSPVHAVNKWHCMFRLKRRGSCLLCSLVGADRA